jgi:hypothetical protein
MVKLSLQTALFCHEDGGNVLLRNVDIYPQDNTVSQPRTLRSEQ